MKRNVQACWVSPGEPLPPASRADRQGLVAIGEDLSVGRLLEAYRKGIFPWYQAGEPVLWFSPDPRMVLVPRQLRPDRGMRRNLRRASHLRLTFDTAFAQVVAACASVPRRGGHAGTWITPELAAAFVELHWLGYAHSAEAWDGPRLVGGLYGLALGRVFFGESMFHQTTGASIAALVHLVRRLADWDFRLFDCQTASQHTARLGAQPWPRERFLAELAEAVALPGRPGCWSL